MHAYTRNIHHIHEVMKKLLRTFSPVPSYNSALKCCTPINHARHMLCHATLIRTKCMIISSQSPHTDASSEFVNCQPLNFDIRPPRNLYDLARSYTRSFTHFAFPKELFLSLAFFLASSFCNNAVKFETDRLVATPFSEEVMAGLVANKA